jgi:hypothetical protein
VITRKVTVEIDGRTFVLDEVVMPGPGHPDWCKDCKRVTGEWYTPNGNTYCSECDRDK